MQPLPTLTEDEYLARERTASARSELVGGHPVAMAGASLRHNAIVRNLLVALSSRLRGRPCQPYPSDVRVHVPVTGLYAYPDVSIFCEPVARHPKDAHTFLNPRVLCEVLSEATEAYDRGAKFSHYRAIASLETYVLVSQLEARVEWYTRGEGGWVLHEAVGDRAVVELLDGGVTLPIAELYADLPAE